ncbi:MAG: MBL fold metallo-hydrolase [Saprospiraceae bacterium]|nr:MBL fold metallo-hydrolase [Saprospiraceae bacterium]
MKIQLETKDLIIFESSLFRTTSTLLVGQDYLLLVDPNWLPIEIDFIERYVESIKANRQPYLLFTHSDYDHIIGYGRFSHYRCIASSNFVRNGEKADVLNQIMTFDDEYYIERNYPVTYPVIDLEISDQIQKLSIGGESFTFYQAPGHNRDGILTHQLNNGVLIVGDYLSNIEFPYVYHSFAEYSQTLDQLDSIIKSGDVKILVTGHGDFTHGKTEMIRRIGDSRSYLDRLEASIRSGSSFDLDKLFDRYKFPKIMKKFHEDNMELMKRELSL